MLRLEALGDHPLIKFGVTTMDKSAHADMMNSQNLMSTRTDLIRTIVEKEELLRRYRAIEFTIYEMRKGCYVWSIKYLVDTDDSMSPLPEGWSCQSIVWSIVLGEREDDSLLVINLCGKVVEYNLISKTLREIYDGI
ncbi:hypothetical protein Tco_0763306 [Tanacetum coccineum]